jgi:cation transport ATPase
MVYDDTVRKILADIVNTYGTSIHEESRRCRALLSDYARGMHKPAVNALMMAVEEDVPKELLSAKSDQALEGLINKMTQKLATNRSMTQEAARWAVESWAFALALKLEKQQNKQEEQQKKKETEEHDKKEDEKVIEQNPPKLWLIAAVLSLIFSALTSFAFLLQSDISIQSIWLPLFFYGVTYSFIKAIQKHNAPYSAKKLQGILCILIALTLFVLGIRTL